MVQFLLTICLASFTNVGLVKIGLADEFIDSVDKAYDTYIIDESYASNDYEINTIIGSKDGKITYGLSFYSTNSKQYKLRVLYNEQFYQLEENTRGDVFALALNIKEGEKFSLVVFDKNSRKQTFPDNRFSGLKIPTNDEYLKLDGIKTGQGVDKVETVSLTKNTNDGIAPILFIVTGAIVLVAAVILFIYYKSKKGMFNEEVRKQNVFNFREFLNTNNVNNSDREDYPRPFFENAVEEQIDDQNQKLDFGVRYSFSRDEDDESGYDIKEYLEKKGFITEYRVISDDEKNQITVELMMLRDTNVISKNEYLEEMGKLWKKWN